jgi:hypothetical protein
MVLLAPGGEREKKAEKVEKAQDVMSWEVSGLGTQ